VFIRALRLLHSTSKESGIQLKAMLDESIKMKKNPGLQSSKLTTPATQQSREAHAKESSESPEIIRESSYCDIDIDLEDNKCEVCNTTIEEYRNKLLKCSECRSYYHQKCHQPVITGNRIELFRVWICFKCHKSSECDSLQPRNNSLNQKTSKVSTMQPIKSSRPASGRSEISSSAVFKRTDTSKSHGSTSSSSSGGKPAGMAALAATYKGSSGSSSTSNLKGSSRSGSHGSSFGHSKTTTGSASTSSSSSTIMSADKRLQLMKKKAAQRKK